MTRPISLIMNNDKMNDNANHHESYNESQIYDENDLSVETIQALYNQQIMILTKGSTNSLLTSQKSRI